jgi:hypothetical protein
MNEVLNGSNPKADARLLADIHASDVALNALDRISNGEFGSDVTPQEQVSLLRDVARKAIGTAAANDLRKIRGTEDEAPDPFDGGCPADVSGGVVTRVTGSAIGHPSEMAYEAARPVPPATSFANKLDALQRESEAAGVRAAIIWLRDNGWVSAGILESAHARGEVLK